MIYYLSIIDRNVDTYNIVAFSRCRNVLDEFNNVRG